MINHTRVMLGSVLTAIYGALVAVGLPCLIRWLAER